MFVSIVGTNEFYCFLGHNILYNCITIIVMFKTWAKTLIGQLVLSGNNDQLTRIRVTTESSLLCLYMCMNVVSTWDTRESW